MEVNEDILLKERIMRSRVKAFLMLTAACSLALVAACGSDDSAGAAGAGPDATGGETGQGEGGTAGEAGSAGAIQEDGGDTGGTAGGSESDASPESAVEAAAPKDPYGGKCDDGVDECIDSFSCRSIAGPPTTWACMKACNDVSDCPKATNPQSVVACIPFTSGDKCLLICKNGAEEYPCPEGMGCIVTSGFGMCVWYYG